MTHVLRKLVLAVGLAVALADGAEAETGGATAEGDLRGFRRQRGIGQNVVPSTIPQNRNDGLPHCQASCGAAASSGGTDPRSTMHGQGREPP
jgi:hypothetical protein